MIHAHTAANLRAPVVDEVQVWIRQLSVSYSVRESAPRAPAAKTEEQGSVHVTAPSFLDTLLDAGLEVLYEEHDFRRYQSDQRSVFSGAYFNTVLVCLQVAPIEALWVFWPDWYPRKISSAHKTSSPGRATARSWARPVTAPLCPRSQPKPHFASH